MTHGTVNDFAHQSLHVLRFHVRRTVLQVIFSHSLPLHFFFQLPIPVRRVAQLNCHHPYKTRHWSMGPIESDVTRSLDCTADCDLNLATFVPLFTNLRLRFVGAVRTYTFKNNCEYKLQVQGWVSLAPVARSCLGVYPHGRGELRSHQFSFIPSFYLVHHRIAWEKVAFGTAAKGRHTYGDMSPLGLIP